MSLLKVQFNHPGNQKLFKIGSGYKNIGNNIIREWNNDGSHYRKFLLNNGEYLDNLSDSKPKETSLYFWGEWEGNSIFEQLINNNYQILPNGIHQPFHSTAIKGEQNTDPYIFGNEFKYCICKQTGNLCDLDPNSLILFGSTFPSIGKFYIDTVFVIKNNIPAADVYSTGATEYSQTYIETTLEQLPEYLKVPHSPSENHKLYHSQTWWDNKEYFSFVPCKLNFGDNGFERLSIDLNNPIFNLSSNPTGKSFLKDCNLTPKQLWNEIMKITQEQGFKLGVRFTEPKSFESTKQTNQDK